MVLTWLSPATVAGGGTIGEPSQGTLTLLGLVCPVSQSRHVWGLDRRIDFDAARLTNRRITLAKERPHPVHHVLTATG